jgi:hypothetical protein
MVTLPLADPDIVGANATVKLVLWPAIKVIGALTPPSVKPDPLTATCEIVMLDVLELVTVSESDCVLPTVTLPKLKLAEFEPREPDAMPLPESEIVVIWREGERDGRILACGNRDRKRRTRYRKIFRRYGVAADSDRGASGIRRRNRQRFAAASVHASKTER